MMVVSFVMELLQWHKVCELGGGKLHRPPVVALKTNLKPQTKNLAPHN